MHQHQRLLDHHDRAAHVLVLERAQAPDPRRVLVVGVDRASCVQVRYRPSAASPTFAVPM